MERRRHRDDGRCCGDGEGGFGRRISPVVKEGRPHKGPTSWLIFVSREVAMRAEERERVMGVKTGDNEVVKHKIILNYR